MAAGFDAPARTAWCYGDPGIAAALLVAARAVRERAWEHEAIRVGLRAAARPAEEGGVQDACLCHGSAGLGHIFHRLYRATKDKRFARAARAWFARTLATRRERAGFAGFVPSLPAARSGAGHTVGFLTGAAGIALALVAATTPLDPIWDRALLLS
jgi:lantibiotic modifying enzyme